MSRLPRAASVTAAAATLATSLGLAASAFAAIDPSGSTIGDVARLSPSGKSLHLTGVVSCATCRSFTLVATVSQGASGAVGQGGVRCVCHGAREHWLLTARAREDTKFQPGAARVCVWILARGVAGRAIDAEQRCESVTLRFTEA